MRVVAAVLLIVLAGCASSPVSEGAPEPEPANIEFHDEEDIAVDVACVDEDQATVVGLHMSVLAPHGKPLADAGVSVLGTELFLKTGEDGVALFEDLEAGARTIRIQPAEDYYKTVELNLTVRDDVITCAAVTLSVADGLLSPPHVHDAWQGRTRFELFSVTHDRNCAGLQSYCVEGTDARKPFKFPFPDEAVVPAGTARMHVSVTWDSPIGSDFWLALHPPTNYATILKFGASGDVLEYEVALEDWDPPHSGTSLWQYEFDPDLLNNQGIWMGPYTITLEVERIEGDLPVDPPHPDLWEGRSSIKLADHTDAADPIQMQAGGTRVNSPPIWTFDDGALVVPGTSQLWFRGWFNFTTPQRGDMALHYDPSGRTSGVPDRMAVASSSGNYFEWYIDVPEAWWDPIYETRTQWRFYVEAAPNAAGLQWAPHSTHVTVHALR